MSGAGTDEVIQAVKEASEIYPFMKWLEPYLEPRKTVSNCKPVGVEEEFNEDTEEESRPAITPTASESDSGVPSNSSGTPRIVSSANIFAQDISRQLGRSFTYIKKSRGPRILPWGAPQVNILALDTLH